MTLYEYYNVITGDGYVGKTKRPIEERDEEHIRDLRKGIHCNLIFQAAFNKYGEGAFKLLIREKFDTIEELNKAEEDTVEEEWDRLYNLVPGGDGSGGVLIPVVGMNIKTREIREYVSVTDVEKDGFSPKNIGGSCRLTVYKATKKEYTNSRLSHRGWVWMYKEDFNLEEMERRRQLAIRGKIVGECSVIGKNLKTGNVVSFMSGIEAKKTLHIRSCITNACIFDKVKSAGGYVWVYADEENATSLLVERYLQLKDRKKPIGTLKKMTPIVGMNLITKEIIEYTDSYILKKDGFSFNSVYNAINEAVSNPKNSKPYIRLHYKGYVWTKKEENFILVLENKINKVKNSTRGAKWL